MVTKRAILFPGQGAHDLKMLDGLVHNANYNHWYDIICDNLQSDPVKEIQKQNIAYINQNLVSSVLTVFVSCISLEHYLNIIKEKPQYYAGYSVGQWTALYAAKAINFEQLIEIIRIRAEFMNQCFEDTEGAMMAVIGLKEDILSSFLNDIRQKGHYIEISNFNCVGQYSIAGTKDAIDIACSRIEMLNPKKVIKIPVQGAWHCKLLDSAEKAFSEYLSEKLLRKLKYTVIDNVTGAPLSEDIHSSPSIFAKQINHPVKWLKGMKWLLNQGCNEFVEVGYGNTLTKFGFFIDRDVNHRSFCANSKNISLCVE
jgi:[acyl-carrier-protein] S-malonyltransferase